MKNELSTVYNPHSGLSGAGIQSVILAMVAVGLTIHAAGAGAAQNAQRPNIVFIMSDDHASAAISAYSSTLIKTPNLDRIAAEGMRFDRCFVVNSICTPSRAAILTGQYSHINGVKTFTPMDPTLVTLPKLLQKAGYQTAVIGKWHLMNNPTGFDTWSILPGQGKYFDPTFIEFDGGPVRPDGTTAGKTVSHKGYVTDIITDKCIDFLKNRSTDRPFLLLYHHKAPHDMWEYDPKYGHLFKDSDLPEPPDLFDDYQTRASPIKTTKQKIGVQHTLYAKETGHLSGAARKSAQYQEFIKRYLRCVASIDDNVGRFLDYLDQSGLARNTLVIYTSDQGAFLGEHGLFDKRFMYEDSLRMPFLVRYPGYIKPGTVNRDIVLNVDFAPTLLELAGVPFHAGMQGRSFRAQLQGQTPSDWRTAMYYRYYFSHFDTEPHYGVRTLHHKLIYYQRLNEWELFDLDDDPREVNNRYGDPSYGGTVDQLKATLGRLRAELKDDEG